MAGSTYALPLTSALKGNEGNNHSVLDGSKGLAGKPLVPREVVIGGTEYLHCGVLAKVEEEVGSGFVFHISSMAPLTSKVKRLVPTVTKLHSRPWRVVHPHYL